MRPLNLLMVVATLIATAFTSVKAQQISIEEAQRSAQDHVARSRALKSSTRPAREQLTLAYTATSTFNEDENCFYVFNRNAGGFVIAAADGCAHTIIGTCDEGTFNYDNMPENVRWWIDEYTKQISTAMLNGAQAPVQTSTKNSGSRMSVEPLLTTKWDQGDPYNTKCPLSNDKSSYTGCVATALGQVLNYHKWPEQTSGIGSYSVGTSLYTVDMDGVTFDWDNMPSQLNSESTQEQIDAVSTLLYNCGLCVNTSYSEAGSSAYMKNIVQTLEVCMNYSKTVSYRDRSFFTDQQWEDLIYNEVANNRPVCYSGGSSANRHAFVCDGYNADDNTFHINWGWSGNCDGYFKLSALTALPGNSYYDFTPDQGAVIGIKRPEDGDKRDAPIFATAGCFAKVLSGYLYMQSYDLVNNTSGKHTCVTSYCSTNNNRALTDSMAVKLVNVETGAERFMRSTYLFKLDTKSDGTSYGYGYAVNSIIQKGQSYVATAYYKDDDTWKQVIYPEGTPTTAVITRNEDGTYVVKTPASISIDNVNVISAYAGSNLNMEVTISNAGQTDYAGEFQISLLSADGSEATAFTQTVECPGMQTSTATITASLEDVNKGNYTLAIDDGSGSELTSSEISVSQKTYTDLQSPVTDDITITAQGNLISVNAPQEIITVSIYNTTGMMVANATEAGSCNLQINMSHVPSGVYLVKATTAAHSDARQIVLRDN
ncbi:MAG: C10 family peptidase [Muribaculaceae bacterium]